MNQRYSELSEQIVANKMNEFLKQFTELKKINYLEMLNCTVSNILAPSLGTFLYYFRDLEIIYCPLRKRASCRS